MIVYNVSHRNEHLRWNVECPCHIKWNGVNKLKKRTWRNDKKQTHFSKAHKNVTQHKKQKANGKQFVFVKIDKGKNGAKKQIGKVKNNKRCQKVENILKQHKKNNF